MEVVLDALRGAASEAALASLARFRVNTERALGVPMPAIRAIAKSTGRDHELAMALWATQIHEARILATLVAEPARTNPRLMDTWARDFDSWDLVDHACGNLFDRTPHAVGKALTWSTRRGEYQKRAAFALMASLAVHDKRAPDETFTAFLEVCEREAWDDRNFVRKAVNWAVRQIGKRNDGLRPHAIAAAERIREQGTKSARWIASDALRELTR